MSSLGRRDQAWKVGGAAVGAGDDPVCLGWESSILRIRGSVMMMTEVPGTSVRGNALVTWAFPT